MPTSTYKSPLRPCNAPVFFALTPQFRLIWTAVPEYNDIPFTYLMYFLSDSKHKTADELYQMALRKEIQISF